MSIPDWIQAHQFSSNHRELILKSTSCGCFFCLSIFKPSEIIEWIDEKTTAICPKCGVDSVIGSESQLPIKKEFLKRMKEYWFKP